MKPDVVLVFAFGARWSIANIRLVRKAEAFGKIGPPIFTQWDLPVGEGTVFFAEDVLRTRENWEEGQNLSTLDVVQAFEYVAWKKGWRKVLILAAPQHMKRCLRDARRRLLHPEISRVMPYHWTLPWVWYNTTSDPWYTRGRVRWWLREGIIRCLPWGLYVDLADGKFG